MIETLMLFMAMLLLAMLVEPLAERIHVPFSALLVVIGFVGSELITGAGIDTGFRWQHFNNLILHLFVPILVFESAFNMNAKALLKNLVPILFLAVPAMLVASLITGIAIYYGIGHPAFPFAAALLTGVMLSATDPVAVVALFKKLGAPERLNVLLEGESLFNDATAVVVFTLLTTMILMPEQGATPGEAVLAFGKTFIGGVLVGSLCAGVGMLLYRFFCTERLHSVISIIVAVSAFYFAEHSLHVSGIVSVLCAGLLLGHAHRETRDCNDHFTPELWELNAYICNAILFLLVGVTIQWSMFTDQYLAMLIGIVGATLARAVVVYGLFPVLTATPLTDKVPGSYKPVMMWGGLRGAVSLALALSIPTEIDSWYTIQSIAYGVVLFTLFVQAPFMNMLVQRTLKAQ